ncbi:hypothetical protein [Cellulomonas fengjieae]|uniref:DUF559 domain-containing protein n=1 Tax=Cellulomonas fengjieae TaxID=2819978 RepID=A0ABS3SKD7_9CELL|nr:hypothetical protein [Cellulomonas fengjieae]MBO3086216.1 hypothetical protein [Cellulomonas fengjieae]QVI65732.1 hypothetical protein KG102_16875 [Cellulomonas fengjieae]
MPHRPGSTQPAPPTAPTVHLARDVPRQVVAERVAAQQWRRVGRGVYVPTGGATDKRSDALARIVGLHARLTAETCFSHTSAAVLLGLPLWETGAVTHIFQRSSASQDRSPEIARHTPFPPPDDMTVIAGIPATTLGRTAWDCASLLRPLGGLVVVDAALRAGADPAELAARADATVGRRGSGRARAVLQFADGGSESAWETACRFTLLRAGLPVPQTQIPVATRLGTFWADLGWAQWRVLLEYDGRTKYAGREAEAFLQEKRRHDAIVEADWRIIHVTRDDLRNTAALIARVAGLLPQAVTSGLRPRRELY